MLQKSLIKALSIFDYFNMEHPAWGARDLADSSGIPRATVQRLLSSFAEMGFLVQDSANKKYSLGIKVFELGSIFKQQHNITTLIHPIMEKIQNKVHETVFLCGIDRAEGVCLDIVKSNYSLQFSTEVGSRFSLLKGAHAKAILAFLDHDQQTLMLDKYINTDQGLIDIKREIDNIRQLGWSYTTSEVYDNVTGVAVPLLTRDKKVVGSLTVAGLSERLNQQSPEMIAAELKAEANQVAQILFGFN